MNGDFDITEISKTLENKLAGWSYNIINDKAISNSFVQGVYGFFGLGVGLIADGIAIVHHYRTMLRHNQKNNKSICQPIFHHSSSAKYHNRPAMMAFYFLAWWKISMAALDLLFIFMCLNEIRELYGRKRFSEDFKFTQPFYGMFKKMVVSVYGNSQEEFDNKIENAMNAFE